MTVSMTHAPAALLTLPQHTLVTPVVASRQTLRHCTTSMYGFASLRLVLHINIPIHWYVQGLGKFPTTKRSQVRCHPFRNNTGSKSNARYMSRIQLIRQRNAPHIDQSFFLSAMSLSKAQTPTLLLPARQSNPKLISRPRNVFVIN